MSENAAIPLRNAKHEAVLQHYFADSSRVGWRCYQRVYPRSTQRAAETGFSRLLKTADFGERLAWLQKSAADSNVMDLNEVLVELSKLGRSNIKRAVLHGDDSDELVESIENLPEDAAATVQELTIETYVEGGGEDAREVKRVKIKLHSKHAALAELRRHHEPERHEHTGAGGGAIEHHHDVDAEMTELELARRIAFALEKGARAPRPAATAKPARPARKSKPKKMKGKKR
jgi:phage terminase small subunit